LIVGGLRKQKRFRVHGFHGTATVSTVDLRRTIATLGGSNREHASFRSPLRSVRASGIENGGAVAALARPRGGRSCVGVVARPRSTYPPRFTPGSVAHGRLRALRVGVNRATAVRATLFGGTSERMEGARPGFGAGARVRRQPISLDQNSWLQCYLHDALRPWTDEARAHCPTAGSTGEREGRAIPCTDQHA
jgi:hypothetical protein